MIGYIEGEVLHKGERGIIISAGGLGYLTFVTPPTLTHAALGEKLSLWTHLSVREDALDLFGFASREELRLFQLLIGISGIGPKSALNVLSLADPATISHAIASGDSAYLTKVSGIGKKLAQKIVLELREKMGDLTIESSVIHAESDALEALESLGYMPKDTRALVRILSKEHSSTQDIVRKALQTLGKR